MFARKESGEESAGTLSFRKAIWERMAAMDIGSPNALAKRLHGKVSNEALYNYLCDGKELSADKLEAVFNVLEIGLTIASHAPVEAAKTPPIPSGPQPTAPASEQSPTAHACRCPRRS